MIFLILLAIILFVIVFTPFGENTANHWCEDANTCPASVRCSAKSKEDCNCFEPKNK